MSPVSSARRPSSRRKVERPTSTLGSPMSYCVTRRRVAASAPARSPCRSRSSATVRFAATRSQEVEGGPVRASESSRSSSSGSCAEPVAAARRVSSTAAQTAMYPVGNASSGRGTRRSVAMAAGTRPSSPCAPRQRFTEQTSKYRGDVPGVPAGTGASADADRSRTTAAAAALSAPQCNASTTVESAWNSSLLARSAAEATTRAASSGRPRFSATSRSFTRAHRASRPLTLARCIASTARSASGIPRPSSWAIPMMRSSAGGPRSGKRARMRSSCLRSASATATRQR